MKDKIKTKLLENKKLTENEIEYLNENIIVYDFTNSLGHLTLFGKNERVTYFKEQLLEEIARQDYFDEN
jgi:hypothetical protein